MKNITKMSEARKRANKKWDTENLDRIQLVIRKGNKEFIRECAEDCGESLNRYILNAVKQRVKKEKGIDLL